MAESEIDGSFVAASTLTCPECGHRSKEAMPTNACQYFYDCKGCGALLKPKPGDCCVYCSFGDVACPSIQLGDDCRG
ncbi:GDCCVxC domain-containing (seleno)protein [Hyphomonas johnsonii]|uniref:GDCCVxC domain-containing (seleno)protein n=1 Tax=Hyphomonas johnsonii TaxID=81031 RepID=UPI0009FE027D|nr:GDCCVxC domain-containing (seleno)protein [Hyphomonas johnsonii]